MKITIEMENLNKLIEETVRKNTEDTLDEYVAEKTKAVLEEQYGEKIEEAVSLAIAKAIENYIMTYEIKVGNPFDGQEEKIYTPMQYINATIQKIFEDEILIQEKQDSWSGRKEIKKISFKDYIKSQFDIDGAIQKHMNDFSSKLRKEVNSHMESAYNKATRDAISDVVLDTIMENEKFKNINDNIKKLGE